MHSHFSRNGFQIQIEQESRTLLLEPQPVDGSRVVPSSYLDLVHYVNEQAPASIGLRNMQVLAKQAHGDETFAGTASFDFSPAHPAKIFILIEQGWTLPGPWVDADLLFLDRNVVIGLEDLLPQEGEPFSMAANYWADLLGMCSSECHLLTFAVEGRTGQKPGLRAFLDELSRAYSAAYRCFPKEQLSPLDAARLQGGIGLIRDFERYFKKAAAFLGKVMPMLSRAIAANERYSVYKRIGQAAEFAGFKISEPIVLLAFSLLYEAAGGKHPRKPINPGRAILKPSKPDFYNSAFDAWQLELLIGANSISDKRVGLVTKDKGMAALWCLLKPRNFRIENGAPTATITFSQQLVPAMSDKEYEKFAKMLQDDGVT